MTHIISHPVVATGVSAAVASLLPRGDAKGERASPEGWEIIICVYTMVSLNSQPFSSLNHRKAGKVEKKDKSIDFSSHQQWSCGGGWKNTLNNLRLILQPTRLLWLIFPWLDILPNSKLLLGLNHLISSINQCQPFYSSA